MSLRSLDLEVTYRSDSNHLVNDFYVPCLRRATVYKRAVGYFTSSGLSAAARGIARLLEAGGRMELIASPHFEEADVEAIQGGIENRRDVLRRVCERSFRDVQDKLTNDRLNALAWLVADGLLDVKIAFRVDENGKPTRGIYHEKIGIIEDREQNYVAFSGSSNETTGGLIDNFETIDVYWSWADPQLRAQRKRDAFERLWEDSTDRLMVVDFSVEVAQIIEKFRAEPRPKFDPTEKPETISKPVLPSEIKLREYQNAAINNWFRNNGRGTLKMATGSGKTITALAAVSRLAARRKLNGLIIVCPTDT